MRGVICEVVSDLIDKMGYQAITACDGNEALDIFRDRQAQIDLVIVDMVMPGLSGEEVADAMRAIAPDIKVILTSGFPEAEEVQSAMRDTRQTFLQKPLQSKTLSATISVSCWRCSLKFLWPDLFFRQGRSCSVFKCVEPIDGVLDVFFAFVFPYARGPESFVFTLL